MTKEDAKATIAALLEERRGYELRKAIGEEEAKADDGVKAAAGADLAANMSERIGMIDAQLKALGHGAKKASATASKRPSRRAARASKR